jgi:hypothetical protein
MSDDWWVDELGLNLDRVPLPWCETSEPDHLHECYYCGEGWRHESDECDLTESEMVCPECEYGCIAWQRERSES